MVDYSLGDDCEIRRNINNILMASPCNDKIFNLVIKFSDLGFFNLDGKDSLSLQYVDCSLEKIRDNIESELDKLYEDNVIVPMNYMRKYNCVVCNKEAFIANPTRKLMMRSKWIDKGAVLLVNKYFCEDCLKEIFNQIRIDTQSGGLR